jgi:hypothetical protein
MAEFNQEQVKTFFNKFRFRRNRLYKNMQLKKLQILNLLYLK